MGAALIVSSGEKGRELLAEALAVFAYERIDFARTAAEARTRVGKNVFEMVVINAPLADESGDALARHVAQNSHSGVLLIARPDEPYFEAACEEGVMTLAKPVSRSLLDQAVRHARAAFFRIDQKSARLQGAIDEARLINRAKAMLMEHLNMTEPSAHRFIEKQAMALRMTRIEIAKNILTNYSP